MGHPPYPWRSGISFFTRGVNQVSRPIISSRRPNTGMPPFSERRAILDATPPNESPTVSACLPFSQDTCPSEGISLKCSRLVSSLEKGLEMSFHSTARALTCAPMRPIWAHFVLRVLRIPSAVPADNRHAAIPGTGSIAWSARTGTIWKWSPL